MKQHCWWNIQWIYIYNVHVYIWTCNWKVIYRAISLSQTGQKKNMHVAIIDVYHQKHRIQFHLDRIQIENRY